MPDVVVYSKVPCAYCVQAKALLEARGIPFEERDLTGDYKGIADLASRTGMLTLPQIFVGDTFVGGYTETSAADKTGKLAKLLEVEAA